MNLSIPGQVFSQITWTVINQIGGKLANQWCSESEISLATGENFKNLLFSPCDQAIIQRFVYQGYMLDVDLVTLYHRPSLLDLILSLKTMF